MDRALELEVCRQMLDNYSQIIEVFALGMVFHCSSDFRVLGYVSFMCLIRSIWSFLH